MKTLDIDHHAANYQTEEFVCPFCGKPIVLWPERFKGSGKVLVRATHPHNASANCNAVAEKGDSK